MLLLYPPPHGSNQPTLARPGRSQPRRLSSRASSYYQHNLSHLVPLVSCPPLLSLSLFSPHLAINCALQTTPLNHAISASHPAVFQHIHVVNQLSLSALLVLPSVASTAALLAQQTTIRSARKDTQLAMEERGLFSDKLVSPEVSVALPKGYRLRALRRSDYESGFLDCLRVLTTVGDVTEAQFQQQYDRMEALGSYYIIVVEDTSRTESSVVATGALIVEQKLYVCVTHPTHCSCTSTTTTMTTTTTNHHTPLQDTTHASENLQLTQASYPVTASTAWAPSATSRTLPSQRTNRARSSACASSSPSTTSPPRLAATRASSTAATSTRASTSSAGFDELDSRWRTITRATRVKLNSPVRPQHNHCIILTFALCSACCMGPAFVPVLIWAAVMLHKLMLVLKAQEAKSRKGIGREILDSRRRLNNNRHCLFLVTMPSFDCCCVLLACHPSCWFASSVRSLARSLPCSFVPKPSRCNPPAMQQSHNGNRSKSLTFRPNTTLNKACRTSVVACLALEKLPRDAYNVDAGCIVDDGYSLGNCLLATVC